MGLLHIIDRVNDDIHKLLARSVIGTPGKGMRYQHGTVYDRIMRIKTPFFVELRTKLSLIGTCCFCYRSTWNSGATFHSFYIRFFSFNERYRNGGVSNKVKKRRGILRDEIQKLFDIGKFCERSDRKHFHYAYVDPKNIRSVQLCREFGFTEIRRFTTFVFSRIAPKVDGIATLVALRAEEIPTMAMLLTDIYSGYNMFSLENVTIDGQYYVIKDPSGEIMAGAHVAPTQWKIFEMNSRGMTGLLRMLSGIPFVNRIFNTNFRFLAIDGLYFREGKEHWTEIILSSLLKKYGYYNAFIPADNCSTLHEHLSKLDLGFVSKMSKQVPVNVICRFSNFSMEEIGRFQERPAYVSAVDIS